MLCIQVMFNRRERAKGGSPGSTPTLSTKDKSVHTYVNGELQPQVRGDCGTGGGREEGQSSDIAYRTHHGDAGRTEPIALFSSPSRFYPCGVLTQASGGVRSLYPFAVEEAFLSKKAAIDLVFFLRFCAQLLPRAGKMGIRES